MKLIVQAHSTNEHSEGAEFALVDLDVALALTIQRRKAQLDELKNADRDVDELVFFSYAAEFFDTPAFDHFQEDFEEKYGDIYDHEYGHFPAPDGFTVSDEDHARTECDRMVINENGVTFRAYPKHCDWMVETHEIDYAVVESAAKEVPVATV